MILRKNLREPEDQGVSYVRTAMTIQSLTEDEECVLRLHEDEDFAEQVPLYDIGANMVTVVLDAKGQEF